MPPRLLISATASIALLVAAGPQIPGEPEKVRKLATRSLLRAGRSLEDAESVGCMPSTAVDGDDRLRNNSDGGAEAPPWHPRLTVESTHAPLGRHRRAKPLARR